MNASPGTLLRSWVVWLVLLAAGLGVVRHHFRLAVVVGNSMRPGLHSGDLLTVWTHAYENVQPARGDLVLANNEGQVMVKRVVGLPGEEIEVQHGRLLIDHCGVAEAYVTGPSALEIGTGHLAEGQYALVGDNRALSSGEVVHAVVRREQLLGKVVGVCHWGRRCTRGSSAGNTAVPRPVAR